MAHSQQESLLLQDFIKEEPIDIMHEKIMEGDDKNIEFEFLDEISTNNSAFFGNLKTEPLHMDDELEAMLNGNESSEPTLTVETAQNTKTKRERRIKRYLTPMATADMLMRSKQLKQIRKLKTERLHMETAQNTKSRKRNVTPMATEDMLKESQQLKNIHNQAKSPKLPTLPIVKEKVDEQFICFPFGRKVPALRCFSTKKNIEQQHAGENLDLKITKNMDANSFMTDGYYQTSNGPIKSCAVLQFLLFENAYMIKCLYCHGSYLISNWKKFISHLKAKHPTEVSLDILPQESEKCTDKPQSETAPTANNAVSQQLPLEPRILEIETVVENEQSLSDSDESLLSQNFNEDDEDVVDNAEKHHKVSAVENTKQRETVLNFETSCGKRISSFLEVLRLHPMLWRTRRHGPSEWDTKAAMFLRDFDPGMSIVDLQKSLDNAHTFYRKYHAEQNNEFQLYKKVLREITKLSKIFIFKCTHCEAYFFDGNNLLRHQFTQHKIEHFPFKCKCCHVHFSSHRAMMKHQKLFALKWSLRAYTKKKEK